MNKKLLKIFIYNKNGEKIKEDSYSNFIDIFNETLEHNFEYEEDNWNLVVDFSFPPLNHKWDIKTKKWLKKQLIAIKIL